MGLSCPAIACNLAAILESWIFELPVSRAGTHVFQITSSHSIFCITELTLFKDAPVYRSRTVQCSALQPPILEARLRLEKYDHPITRTALVYVVAHIADLEARMPDSWLSLGFRMVIHESCEIVKIECKARRIFLIEE